MSLFITFEGIEGSGKTTQMRLLKERFETAGVKVTATREPGGCPISDQIRAILLDAANSAITPTAELLLYAAARAQHVEQVIAPALERGDIVLCDRFTDATVAYQGCGRGLDLSVINQLNVLATGRVRPDLTLLIDCAVETGLGRAKARIDGTQGPKEDRFEQESLRFHEKVRQGYLDLAGANPQRYVVVEGSGGVAETQELLLAALAGRITGEARFDLLAQGLGL